MWTKLVTKFNFLGSTRFWKLVSAGVAFGLYHGGIIDLALFGAIETVVIGSVTVRTVDRFGENIKGK